MTEVFKKQVAELNLNRSEWRLVKFGEVAIQQKQTIDRENTDLTRYVKGGHMRSEDIHLREWGELRDEYLGPAFIRKFEKGDILYGSRRTYLRKVVVAPFEGITSNTTFVIKANKTVIDERLLPFIMLSEAFTQHSVRNSKGSVNPYVNWKDLSDFEFLLPLKRDQGRLVDLLYAADFLVEKEKFLLDEMIRYKHSFRQNVFEGYDKKVLHKNVKFNDKPEWHVKLIKDAVNIENRLRKPISKEVRLDMKGEYPYYGPTSILDYISEYRVDGEYVLIGEDGDHFLKYEDWNMTQYVSGKFNVNNHAHILSGSAECLTKWIFYSLQHRNVLPHIAKQGATRYKLNKESLENIPFIVPPVNVQKKIVEEFDSIESTLVCISERVSSSYLLFKSLINKVF